MWRCEGDSGAQTDCDHKSWMFRIFRSRFHVNKRGGALPLVRTRPDVVLSEAARAMPPVAWIPGKTRMSDSPRRALWLPNPAEDPRTANPSSDATRLLGGELWYVSHGITPVSCEAAPLFLGTTMSTCAGHGRTPGYYRVCIFSSWMLAFFLNVRMGHADKQQVRNKY